MHQTPGCELDTRLISFPRFSENQRSVFCPNGKGLLQKLSGKTNLDRIELLGPVSRGNHVDDLVVPVVPQLDTVPVVVSQHPLPLVFGNNCRKNILNKSLQNEDKRNSQAEASIAPRSQIIKQFLEHVLPSSKKVFSIWIIVFKRFSWNLKPGKQIKL